MGIVKIKNKKIIRAAACAMLSALLFIAVVICGGKNVFGWFSTNIETDVSGANVSVRTEKIRTDFYVYSYDLYGLHSFDSAVPSATYTAANPAYNAQDPDSEPTLQKPFTLENLKMNPYDRVFVQRNGCTPVVVQIALSGSDLKSEGTINVTLTRDVYKEEPYNVPNYFTSVVKFTCVKGKSIYSENIPSLFESVARIANGASLSEPVNVSVFKNAGTNDAVRSFYTDITTHTEKHDVLTFEIEYTASDFNGNVLNLYLYFDYDKNLIEEFVDNNIYGDISIDEVEVSAENDLLSVSAKPKKNEGGNR